MDIKELNKLIPDSVKLEIKNFAAKFNATPVATVAPTAPVVTTPVATPTPAQFGEGMLEDGVTVIKYNTPELVEGSIVTVVTPEGEMNAPEGEHKLQNGTTITVAVENGVSVVKAVTKPEAPEAPSEEMKNVISQVSGFSEQLKTFASEKESFSKKINEQSEKIEAQKKEIESLNTKVQEFFHLFVKVMELPSDNPIEQPRNKFAKSVDDKASTLSKFKPKN